MATYAQIMNDKVIAIIPNCDGAPGISGVLVDITSEDPMPEVGWTYDDPNFTEPVVANWYDNLTLQQTKDEMINRLSNNCFKYITEELSPLPYPMWRQGQINNYAKYTKWDSDDYDTMHTAINTATGTHDTKKTSINAQTTNADVDAIDITFGS